MNREQRIARSNLQHKVPFDLSWKCGDAIGLSGGDYCVLYIEHQAGDADMTLYLRLLTTSELRKHQLPPPAPREELAGTKPEPEPERKPVFDWDWK